MTDTIDVLIPEETVNARILELAREIDQDFAGSCVTLICVLKGSVFFTAELAKRITIPVFLEFIKVSSYEGMQSGELSLQLDVTSSIKGKNIIVIEDVIDTGKTLTKLRGMLAARNPASLKFCTLLDKHDCRVVPFEGDYVGFKIGNEFVVGYGLDFDQKYRNLPYIGILRRE